MGAFVDLTGREFGHFTVIRLSEKKTDGHVNWLCKCDCGTEVIKSRLNRVKNNHCGCRHLENRATRICSSCNIEKLKIEFHASNTEKCGIQAKCKACISLQRKEYYQNNREDHLKKQTEIRKRPKNLIAKQLYYEKNKAMFKDRYLKYMSDEDKKKRKSESSKLYVKNNKEKVTKRTKEYSQKPEVKQRKKMQHDERKKSDVAYLIKRRLRFRLRHAIKAISRTKIKYKSALDLLGCDIEFFKDYIEKRFTAGMSWDNIHLIDIDHIKPCSKFDLTKIEEQKVCFGYKNLQPLWWQDNLIKSDKYEESTSTDS